MNITSLNIIHFSNNKISHFYLQNEPYTYVIERLHNKTSTICAEIKPYTLTLLPW